VNLKTLHTLGLIAAMVGGDSALPTLPRRAYRETAEKTPADLERLEAARQKRLRRAAKRRTP